MNIRLVCITRRDDCSTAAGRTNRGFESTKAIKVPSEVRSELQTSAFAKHVCKTSNF